MWHNLDLIHSYTKKIEDLNLCIYSEIYKINSLRLKNLIRLWDIVHIKGNGLVRIRLKKLDLKHDVLLKGMIKQAKNSLWVKRMLIWGLKLLITLVLRKLCCQLKIKNLWSISNQRLQ